MCLVQLVDSGFCGEQWWECPYQDRAVALLTHTNICLVHGGLTTSIVRSGGQLLLLLA